jgi:hypothetical protein
MPVKMRFFDSPIPMCSRDAEPAPIYRAPRLSGEVFPPDLDLQFERLKRGLAGRVADTDDLDSAWQRARQNFVASLAKPPIMGAAAVPLDPNKVASKPLAFKAWDQASKVAIARFSGDEYSAERNSAGDLEIISTKLGAGLPGDNGKRSIVCTLSGEHFVAEREGNELIVYELGDTSTGRPGVSVDPSQTSDARHLRSVGFLKNTAARDALRKLNEMNRAFHEAQ